MWKDIGFLHYRLSCACKDQIGLDSCLRRPPPVRPPVNMSCLRVAPFTGGAEVCHGQSESSQETERRGLKDDRVADAPFICVTHRIWQRGVYRLVIHHDKNVLLRLVSLEEYACTLLGGNAPRGDYTHAQTLSLTTSLNSLHHPAC